MPEKKIPLSENERKFHSSWTAQDCINHLRAIAEANPDKVITRNFFRVESSISESTWNRYFGTFEEFKRQAGIKLSRHAHAMERSIAKHASKDAQREMMFQKVGWEDRYLRPDSKRFQTALIGSDFHDIDCDPFHRRLFIDTAQRVQPEKIILNGDTFDLPEFAKWTQDPRDWNLLGRIKWVHELLADLREAAPDAELIMIEGNHEYRLLRHMAEATPALRVILADLHGWTVPKLLGLEQFEVNYMARADLVAFRERDVADELKKNFYIAWNSFITHHFPEGRRLGYPGCNGHHHSHHVHFDYSPQFGPFEWHQIGAGHIREASYTAGERWSNGFLLAHVDTQRTRTQFEYIDCSHEHALVGGRFYQRNEGESLIP